MNQEHKFGKRFDPASQEWITDTSFYKIVNWQHKIKISLKSTKTEKNFSARFFFDSQGRKNEWLKKHPFFKKFNEALNKVIHINLRVLDEAAKTETLVEIKKAMTELEELQDEPRKK